MRWIVELNKSEESFQLISNECVFYADSRLVTDLPRLGELKLHHVLIGIRLLLLRTILSVLDKSNLILVIMIGKKLWGLSKNGVTEASARVYAQTVEFLSHKGEKWQHCTVTIFKPET